MLCYIENPAKFRIFPYSESCLFRHIQAYSVMNDSYNNISVSIYQLRSATSGSSKYIVSGLLLVYFTDKKSLVMCVTNSEQRFSIS